MPKKRYKFQKNSKKRKTWAKDLDGHIFFLILWKHKKIKTLIPISPVILSFLAIGMPTVFSVCRAMEPGKGAVH